MEIKGLITEEYVNTVIRKRPKEIHKGDAGKVLLVAGSKGMTGAAIFASKSAMKSGCGLLKVCAKKKIFPIIQTSVPEAICIKWGKTKKDLEQYDSIAIGPGMGVKKKTKKILKRVLTEYNKTIVIDADGLNTIAKYKKLQILVRNYPGRIIMTPHIGEARRLLNDSGVTTLTKQQIAEALNDNYGCISIVKGAETLVATEGKLAYTNTTGNPGMATAGSGDVLTGIILSLLGQGIDPVDAAKTGVYIHGLAGDIAADKLGEYGVTASDIVACVPYAIKSVMETKEMNFLPLEENAPAKKQNIFAKLASKI